MTVLDPSKPSPLLERIAAVGILWVFMMMSFSLVLPYLSNFLHITINEADRALVNNIVSAINNAFVWVLGFLYGQSVGSRQKDATIATQSDTIAKGTPAPVSVPVLVPVAAPPVGTPPGPVSPFTVAPTASPPQTNAAGETTVTLPEGAQVTVQAVPARPDHVSEKDWATMTDQQKIDAVAKGP